MELRFLLLCSTDTNTKADITIAKHTDTNTTILVSVSIWVQIIWFWFPFSISINSISSILTKIFFKYERKGGDHMAPCFNILKHFITLLYLLKVKGC